MRGGWFSFLFLLCAVGCVSVEQVRTRFRLDVVVVDGEGVPVEGATVTATVSFQTFPPSQQAERLYPLSPRVTDKSGVATIFFVGPFYRVRRSFILWPTSNPSPTAVFALVGLSVVYKGGVAETATLLCHTIYEEFCLTKRRIVVRLSAGERE